MYFVWKNEEIHLSFKDSEKWRTQALSNVSVFSDSQLGIQSLQLLVFCMDDQEFVFQLGLYFIVSLVESLKLVS